MNIIVIGFHFPCASYIVDGGTRVSEPVPTDSPHTPVSQIQGSRGQQSSLLSLGLSTRCYPLIHIPRLHKNNCQDPCIDVTIEVKALFLDIHIHSISVSTDHSAGPGSCNCMPGRSLGHGVLNLIPPQGHRDPDVGRGIRCGARLVVWLAISPVTSFFNYPGEV